MSVAHETLPLSIRELQRTREPLERATQLPQAAFTDPRVLDWELEHVFMRRLDRASGTSTRSASAATTSWSSSAARACSSSPTTTACRAPS